MLRTTSTLTAAALVATLPTIAAADSTAVSLGVSLDDGDVTSVAVAAAFGDFAVTSAVANASATGAASGATDDATTTPSVSVTFNDDADAYETNVAFIAADVAEDVTPEIDCEPIIADFTSETPTGNFGDDILAECGLLDPA